MSSQGQLIRMLRRFSERHSEGKVRRLRSLGVVVKVEVQVRRCSDTSPCREGQNGGGKRRIGQLLNSEQNHPVNLMLTLVLSLRSKRNGRWGKGFRREGSEEPQKFRV